FDDIAVPALADQIAVGVHHRRTDRDLVVLIARALGERKRVAHPELVVGGRICHTGIVWFASRPFTPAPSIRRGNEATARQWRANRRLRPAPSIGRGNDATARRWRANGRLHPAPSIRRGNEATARQWRANGRFIPTRSSPAACR